MTVPEQGARPGKATLIMATDRLPLDHIRDPVLGRARAILRHIVATHQGAWIAAVGDEPAMPEAAWLRPLTIAPELLSAHRDGHCATTLASAYFGYQCVTPSQEPTWRTAYEEVNAWYAVEIARQAAPGARVWVHDFPLQLVPGMLRRLRPDLRIGFSLHSPFPPAESFLTVPGREDILASLAAADVTAFQDSRSAANFTNLAAAMLPGEPLPAITVMPMPADGQTFARLAGRAKVQAHAARIRAALLPATTVFLSLGGHDTADGTLHRLEEFALLLRTGQLDARRHALIHLAQGGDDLAPESAQLRQDTERLTAQINGRHGSPGHCPVHYQRGDWTPAEMAAFYVAADVVLATPMRDRATPYAAEYVAARADGRGHVIVSEFSSTTARLPHATVVNPHEPTVLGTAMLTAAEQGRDPSPAMAVMRGHVLDEGVSEWAHQFLSTLTSGATDTAIDTVTGANHERGVSAPRRSLTIRHRQEGQLHRGQASNTSGRLTATEPHR